MRCWKSRGQPGTQAKTISRCIDLGLLPFTQRYLGRLKNHFSTIGVNGQRGVANFTSGREDITTNAGKALAIDLLQHIREKMVEFQQQTGNLYNLEATPAESATYRFAREDRKRFPDIIQSASDHRTTRTQVNCRWATRTTPSRPCSIRNPRRPYTPVEPFSTCTWPSRSPARKRAANLVRRCLERFRVPYITVTPTVLDLPAPRVQGGEHRYCPKCDEELIARKRAELAPMSREGAQQVAVWRRQAMSEPRDAATVTIADIPELERQPCFKVWTRPRATTARCPPEPREAQRAGRTRPVPRDPGLVQDPTGQLKLGILHGHDAAREHLRALPRTPPGPLAPDPARVRRAGAIGAGSPPRPPGQAPPRPSPTPRVACYPEQPPDPPSASPRGSWLSLKTVRYSRPAGACRSVPRRPSDHRCGMRDWPQPAALRALMTGIHCLKSGRSRPYRFGLRQYGSSAALWLKKLGKTPYAAHRLKHSSTHLGLESS